MKIVQSFWSKPGKKNNDDLFYKNACGWPEKKYNYMSWALSCLNLKKHYDQVALVTDAEGKNLLIDKLELPYTSVHVGLEPVEHYPHDLWAMGKMYAYSIQDSPFLHVDGDVFIWQKFDENIEGAPLTVQQLEIDHQHYGEMMAEIREHFKYIPGCFQQHCRGMLTAVNAGVMGGTDVAFFKKYTAEAFRFVDANIQSIGKVFSLDLFNTIYEQLLFYAMAREQRVDVTCCYGGLGKRMDWLYDFPGTLPTTKYTHAAGHGKRSKALCYRLENRLRSDYPGHYHMIMHKLKTLQI